MAIQTIDLTVPGGDTPRSANTKINANFSNTTHAASRLVGTAAGNVMEVGAFGLGGTQYPLKDNVFETIPLADIRRGQIVAFSNVQQVPTNNGVALILPSLDTYMVNFIIAANNGALLHSICANPQASPRTINFAKILTGHNTTQDANGFLKGASPVIDMYDNKIDLNNDAEQQGGITFEKLATGDYLVKGSLGFAQEGWYIEMPKDANGNVLVAVVYEQLENNDISIKTYAKRFDDETGNIIPNLLKPRDIPDGRFISLRLHELPKEPTVMPTQDTSADTPAQTNNP